MKFILSKDDFKKLPFYKNMSIYLPGMLFMVLMVFMPLFERYAYKFFYASLYALAVAFYSVFVRDHKMSARFIMLLRLLSFVYVAVIALRYNINFAIIGFLTIYQITRLLDLTFFKNYMMSFLIYLGVFYLSLPNHSGIWILLYFSAFIIIGTHFLIANFARGCRLPIPGEKPSPETAGGARDEGESENERAADGGLTGYHIYRLARVYAIYIIFISLAVFILMPRVRLHLFNPFYFRFAGMSSIFSFNSIENIKESSSIIMRITKDGDAGTYYKMKSFNRYWYRRREWIATGFGSRRVRGDSKNNFIINDDTSELTLAPGTLINATYFVKVNSEGYVPHLYFPLSINLTTATLYNDYIENLYASEAEGTIKTSSYVIDPGEDLLRNTQGPDPLRIANYYYFMYPNELGRIRQLARRLTEPHVSRYDKVSAIVSHLQNNFKYTTAVGDLYDEYKDSNYDPNEVFLFMIKAGHCEFFASAMTLMCQSVGIPARLVSGFASPEYNESGDYFLVRGSDAHAWVEVYFPNVGFVAFDPTAASIESEKARFKFLSFLNKYIDNLNFYIENYVSYYSNEFIIGFFVKTYETLKSAMEYAAMTFSGGGDGRAPEESRFRESFTKNFKYNMLLFSPFFVFIFVITFSRWIKPAAFRFLSLFLDARSSYRIAGILSLAGSARPDFYAEFTAALARNGIVKMPAETPYEFNDKLVKLNILPPEYLLKCEKIAGLFYSIKCAMKDPRAAEIDEAHFMIMEIDAKLGASAKSRRQNA